MLLHYPCLCSVRPTRLFYSRWYLCTNSWLPNRPPVVHLLTMVVRAYVQQKHSLLVPIPALSSGTKQFHAFCSFPFRSLRNCSSEELDFVLRPSLRFCCQHMLIDSFILCVYLVFLNANGPVSSLVLILVFNLSYSTVFLFVVHKKVWKKQFQTGKGNWNYPIQVKKSCWRLAKSLRLAPEVRFLSLASGNLSLATYYQADLAEIQLWRNGITVRKRWKSIRWLADSLPLRTVLTLSFVLKFW